MSRFQQSDRADEATVRAYGRLSRNLWAGPAAGPRGTESFDVSRVLRTHTKAVAGW